MPQLPGRPFQRIAQGLPGLLSDGSPLLDLGIGLLSSSGPSTDPRAGSFGASLADAMQFASERQRQTLVNQLLREQMTARQRQQQALARLPGLLSDTSVAEAAPTQIRSDDSLGLNVDIPGRQSLVPRTSTPGGRRELLGLLPDVAPGALAEQALAQAFPEPQKPGGTELTLQAAERRLGRLTPEQVLEIAGGTGTVINVGQNKLDEPLSTSDLNRVRLPDGSPVELGTTARQAREAGARVFTDAELKRKDSIDNALNTLNTLEQLALDPETGVFVDNGGSRLTNNMVARLANGLVNGLGAFAGTDASIRRTQFNATSQGAIASLVRSMGESGALAEGDVTRALSLIPQLGAAPATERQARAQFETLREIISQGVEKLGGQEAANTVDLGGGVTLRFLED